MTTDKAKRIKAQMECPVYLIQTRYMTIDSRNMWLDYGISDDNGRWCIEGGEDYIDEFREDFPGVDVNNIPEEWIAEYGYGTWIWETQAVAYSHKDAMDLLVEFRSEPDDPDTARVIPAPAVGELVELMNVWKTPFHAKVNDD